VEKDDGKHCSKIVMCDGCHSYDPRKLNFLVFLIFGSKIIMCF